MESFKAKYCGAEYHNIDGTGWPDAVVMENDGSVLEGTYELRTYYPERTCHGIFRGTHRGWEPRLFCSECGKELFGNYCQECGSKVVE